MPGILLDDMSSPVANADEAATSRRSGRVSKRPQFLVDDIPASAKRKRDGPDDEIDGEDYISSDGDDDDDEGEPDEEELRARRSKKARSRGSRPAAKKHRTNGAIGQIPIRNTAHRARPRKRAAGGNVPDADQAGGLYGELFAGDKSVEEVVADWIQRFKEHESSALAEIINFVLRCCGCESEVTNYDVEDVDGTTNRLGDLQEEFQAVG